MIYTPLSEYLKSTQQKIDNSKLIHKVVDMIFDTFETAKNKPINLESFLRELNIELKENLDLIYKGKIERNSSNNTSIHIKHYKDERERRFAIAHQLGHYFLHYDEEDYKDSTFFRGLEYSNEELEANEFAVSILMPEVDYRQFANKHAYDSTSNSYDAEKVAKHFKVPVEAAIYRGERLNIFIMIKN